MTAPVMVNGAQRTRRFDENPSSAFGTFSPHQGRRVSNGILARTSVARPLSPGRLYRLGERVAGGRVRGNLALSVISYREALEALFR